MSRAAPTSGALKVQLAAAQDVEALVRLMQEFYAESNYPLDQSWAAASFRALMGRPELGAVWLARSGATAVGYAVLTVRYAMEFGGLSGYIDDLFVKPAFRRQGVGRSLLSALCAECRARGCKSMHVEVGDSNESALALYAKFGLQSATDGRVQLSGVLQAGT